VQDSKFRFHLFICTNFPTRTFYFHYLLHRLCFAFPKLSEANAIMRNSIYCKAKKNQRKKMIRFSICSSGSVVQTKVPRFQYLACITFFKKILFFSFSLSSSLVHLPFCLTVYLSCFRVHCHSPLGLPKLSIVKASQR
jgi:hypothetical protein